MQWLKWVLAIVAATGLAACGLGSSGTSDAPAAAPVSRGTLLVMDPGTRSTAPAAVLGFVHGLHAVVLDGDRVFAGMTALNAKRGADGARTLTLPDGVTAQLIPADNGFDLRFSSGETIPLRQQEGR